MNYKHKQTGYLIIAVIVLVAILFGFILMQVQDELTNAMPVIMVLILIILGSFTSLKVMIDEKHLKINFGYGIFRKQFALNEIASAKIVRNHWYYGWGIHVWFWPKMWIYAISGLDAIEVVMKDGNIYRVGTDDITGLEQAILQGISKEDNK